MPDIADDNSPPFWGILPEFNKLFSQSRALNALNWSTFYQAYQNSIAPNNSHVVHQDVNNKLQPKKGDFDPNTTITCHAEYNEEATIAFNRAHFHRQIYDAMSRNPLSALYSLAWSLCLHIEGQPDGYEENNQHTLIDWINDRNAPYPNNAEYLRVWFPLILLHRMTTQLTRLLTKSTCLLLRISEPLTSDSVTHFALSCITPIHITALIPKRHQKI